MILLVSTQEEESPNVAPLKKEERVEQDEKPKKKKKRENSVSPDRSPSPPKKKKKKSKKVEEEAEIESPPKKKKKKEKTLRSESEESHSPRRKKKSKAKREKSASSEEPKKKKKKNKLKKEKIVEDDVEPIITTTIQLEDYSDKCSTKTKTLVTELTDAKKLEVTILKYILGVKLRPEIIKTGTFSKDYVTYTIVTKPFGYDVNRRFSDFHWLWKMLVKEYPTYVIPPVGRKTKTTHVDQRFVNRRMVTLQNFINFICYHRELRSSEAFLLFVKEPKDQFGDKKNVIEKAYTDITVNFS